MDRKTCKKPGVRCATQLSHHVEDFSVLPRVRNDKVVIDLGK